MNLVTTVDQYYIKYKIYDTTQGSIIALITNYFNFLKNTIFFYKYCMYLDEEMLKQIKGQYI